MSRTSITPRDVEKAYIEVKKLAPNVQPLQRDGFFKSWSIGHVEIGRTARDAHQYLLGLRAGLMASSFVVEHAVIR